MVAVPPFADRRSAGEELARRVAEFAPRQPLVLALPRGGVPVALPIAHRLGAPLELLFVRKIGAPMQRELAVGAVAGSGDGASLVVDEELCRDLGVDRRYLDDEAASQRQEIERQRRLYVGRRASVSAHGRCAIVVDDGIATGTTMRAALQALRAQGAREVVVATPVASASAIELLTPLVDRIVCLATPTPFRAVGLHYLDFEPVEDQDVIALLAAPQPPRPD